MHTSFLVGLLAAVLVVGPVWAGAPADSDDAPDVMELVQGNLVYTADFTNATKSAVRESGGKGEITGVIHEDWSLHNSANFPNKVTATVMEDDGMTQRSFWRVESRKTERHNRDLILLWQKAVIPLPQDEQHRMVIKLQVRGTRGVRVRVHPQPNVTKTEFVFTGQWQNEQIVLTAYPKKDEPEAKFQIKLDVDGSGHDEVTMDLAKVEVRSLSLSVIKQSIAASVPAGKYPPNTMRTSRFPLGLPFGWTPLTKDYSSIFLRAEADPETKGPSGFGALKISATSDDLVHNLIKGDRGMRFTSAPLMIPDTTARHVLSIYARGEGKLSVTVQQKWKPRGGKTIQLKEEDGWQRIEVPFEPVLLDSQPLNAWFVVDVPQGKAIWLDAMQLERGEKAGPYTTQLQAEVQMGLPTDRQTQFDDEPAAAKWAVTGAPKDATLCVRVVNSYHEESEVHRTKLSGEPLEIGTVDYLKWPQRPLGQYRVEAWVEQGGKRISPFDEVLVTRVRRPRYWGVDAPASPFAGHFDSHPRIATAAKAIGFNAVRDWASQWKMLQPQQDQWFDRKMRLQVYRDQHIGVLAVSSAVPQWAQAQFDGLKPTDYPRELSLYGDFIEKFLRFHEGNVEAIEVFNEPWITRHFNKGEPLTGGSHVAWEDAHQRFDDLTRTAQAAARRVDPSVKVVGINTHQADRDWTQGMLRVGGLKHCDVASYHLYAFGRGLPGDTFTWTIRECLDPIFEAQPDMPIWMTEGSPCAHNMGTGLIERIVPGRQSDDGIMQRADRHVRYGVEQLALGVDRIYYYTMGGGGFYEPQSWGWRVLMDGTGTLWPEAAAISNMAWHLENTRFVRTVELDASTFVYLFERTAEPGSVGVIVYDLAAVTKPTYRLPDEQQLVFVDLLGNEVQRGELLPSTATFVTSKLTVQELGKVLRPQ